MTKSPCRGCPHEKEPKVIRNKKNGQEIKTCVDSCEKLQEAQKKAKITYGLAMFGDSGAAKVALSLKNHGRS